MNLNPGEVWLADLGISAKTRPVVIISRHDLDPPRALTIYVPLTTQYRDSLYEVVLPRLRFLDRDSIANIQGMGSIECNYICFERVTCGRYISAI
jgi:mRNA interferase MazF